MSEPGNQTEAGSWEPVATPLSQLNFLFVVLRVNIITLPLVGLFITFRGQTGECLFTPAGSVCFIYLPEGSVVGFQILSLLLTKSFIEYLREDCFSTVF